MKAFIPPSPPIFGGRTKLFPSLTQPLHTSLLRILWDHPEETQCQIGGSFWLDTGYRTLENSEFEVSMGLNDPSHVPSEDWQPFLHLLLYPLDSKSSTKPKKSWELQGGTTPIPGIVSERETPCCISVNHGVSQAHSRMGDFPQPPFILAAAKEQSRKEESV